MRKLIVSEFVTLDGVMEAPGGEPTHPHTGWVADLQGPEQVDHKFQEVADADVLLVGRVTYESFAGAWPEREAAGGDEAEFAKKLGDVRKVVVTAGDPDLSWRNSERLQGDLLDGVVALKADGGGDISMSGSPSVVRQLLEAGLLDELHLLVHPVVVRDGLRLWDEGAALPLRLLSSAAFETGVLHLVYGPDPDPPTGGYDEAVAALHDATT
jgi:dihydrofolate reductase